MLSKILTAATCGVAAYLIDLETHVETGFPGFSIVGLPDSAVRESRERVIAAIKNCGFQHPIRKITVNLAPADIRKEGSAFDLPLALGILAATGQLEADGLSNFVLVGELALDGSLRPVHGVLPIALEIRRRGVRGMILPRENGREAAMVDGLDVYPVATLKEAAGFFAGGPSSILPLTINRRELLRQEQIFPIDFSDVRGQENAKRALEVAAAGGHNILMIGPPGSGKTMLAKRLPTILPPLEFEEALETTKIHSVAGILPPETPLVSTRPFRAPHHTISDAALVGGGRVPRPGEISLAHHGVLFLDELPEFAKNVLEVLRQPLEEGRVTISRARLSVEFPANFMLVCAMNPCPCGYHTDPVKECSCLQNVVQKYLARVSGPLLDRIDLHVDVPAVPYRDLAGKSTGEQSSAIRGRVTRARETQKVRFRNEQGLFCNADMESRGTKRYCRLDPEGDELMKTALNRLGLSARAFDRILKVSRTIADLASSEEIKPGHLSEAIQYRTLDRSLFMGS